MSTRSASVSRRRRGRHAIPQLREKILLSALELFADNGFEKVTADELAAGAQVGKGSVYRQFGSKEGLYAAAVIACFRQLRTQIERVLDQDLLFPDRIAAIVRHVLSSVWERGDFFVLMRDPRTILPSAAARHYRQESRKLSLLISQVLREGADAGWIRTDLNFQLVAESILGMIRGVPPYRRKEITVEAAVRTIVVILLDGLSRGPSPNGRGLSSCGPLSGTEYKPPWTLTARRAWQMHHSQNIVMDQKHGSEHANNRKIGAPRIPRDRET
jgi:AcrR family transcriptional regulator